MSQNEEYTVKKSLEEKVENDLHGEQRGNLYNNQQEKQLHDGVDYQMRRNSKQTDYVDYNNRRCDYQQYGWRRGDSSHQSQGSQSPLGTQDSQPVVVAGNENQGQHRNLPLQVVITPEQSSISAKVETISYHSSQPQPQLNSPSLIYSYQQQVKQQIQPNRSNPTIFKTRQIKKPLTQIDNKSKKIKELSIQVNGMQSQLSKINKNLQLLMGILLEQKQKNDKLQEENTKLRQQKEKLKQRRLREEKRQRELIQENNRMRVQPVFTKSMNNANLTRRKQAFKKKKQDYNWNNILQSSNLKNNTYLNLTNTRQKYQSQFLTGQHDPHDHHKQNFVNYQQQAQHANHQNIYPSDSESQQTMTSHSDHEVLTSSWIMSQIVDDSKERGVQPNNNKCDMQPEQIVMSKDQHQELLRRYQIVQKLVISRRKFQSQLKNGLSSSKGPSQIINYTKSTTYENDNASVQSSMIKTKIKQRDVMNKSAIKACYQCSIM